MSGVQSACPAGQGAEQSHETAYSDFAIYLNQGGGGVLCLTAPQSRGSKLGYQEVTTNVWADKKSSLPGTDWYQRV